MSSSTSDCCCCCCCCSLRRLLVLFTMLVSALASSALVLLASVESDFRFVALMEPIVDVEHAIWTSPAGLALRCELRRVGIEHSLVERHFPLVSPIHGTPLCGGERVTFCAGKYDRIAPAADVEKMHQLWRGSEYLEVPQGHFGYRMMRTMWARLVQRGAI